MAYGARAAVAAKVYKTQASKTGKRVAAAKKSPTPNASARARARASANARFNRTTMSPGKRVQKAIRARKKMPATYNVQAARARARSALGGH